MVMFVNWFRDAPEVSGDMPTRDWLDPRRWGKAQKRGVFQLGKFPRLVGCYTNVDGRHLANQLRLVVYAKIYRVLYISGGAGFFPSTVLNDIEIATQ